ncbi:MAG: redoxin domain-containing protein [Chitinivibrionales bacterium]|nr:redoxin domain-containing protein [Chitinivibrionales bacterium]MBD3358947.1 redoxin domain-containing protein [Chitinivibrionales bacterium]
MGVLVGKCAPDFKAAAVHGDDIIEDFRLSDLKGKHIILFFYPLDFTFVCPTELHAFNERLDDFHERGVELVAASVDSHYSHIAWLATPKAKGGIEGIRYRVVSDMKKEIARDYDVLVEEQGIAYRGLFLIDPNFIVRHQVVNDLPLGRSVDEALRMVDAVQYFDKNGEVCPANWQRGEKAMAPSKQGLESFFG